MRADGTTVHLDEMLDERHAGRDPALRLTVGDLAARGGLGEHSARELARDRSAARADEHGDRPFAGLRRDRDSAAAIHAPRRVVDEIGESTRQALRIGVERNRFARQIELERVPRRLDPRARLLGGALDDGIEQHTLFRELDVAEHYLIGVEQIVREPADLLQLSFDHRVRRMLDRRPRAIVGADDLERVAHRRERVAQLVRKHREELALAMLRVVTVPLELAALVRGGQARDDGIDDRELGGAEALLRSRREHDGAEHAVARRRARRRRRSRSRDREIPPPSHPRCPAATRAPASDGPSARAPPTMPATAVLEIAVVDNPAAVSSVKPCRRRRDV